MGKSVLIGILMVALVLVVRTCEKGSDGDKVKEKACASFIKRYPKEDPERIRKLVHKHHPGCFDKAYTKGSRRRSGETDIDSYNKLLDERIRK